MRRGGNVSKTSKRKSRWFTSSRKRWAKRAAALGAIGLGAAALYHRGAMTNRVAKKSKGIREPIDIRIPELRRNLASSEGKETKVPEWAVPNATKTGAPKRGIQNLEALHPIWGATA